MRIHVWYSSSGESGPEFLVLRQTLTDGQTDIVANIQTADNSGDRKVATANADAAFAAVSNTDYSYGFAACIGQLDAFYAARILYKYSNAGD